MPLDIDQTKCLACGICAERCLLDNIRVKMPPCRAACPLGVNCQAYVTLTALDRDEDALGYVSDGVALPKTLSYVCTHPCETACSRGQLDRPLAIRALKRFLTETAPPRDLDVPPTDGGRVAIVGAGPAGLQAAFSLRLAGHEAAIFDELPEAGGMMRLGIPDFRLPRAVLDEEIARVADLGVEMRLGQRVGTDVQFDDLRRDFDAVVLAVGAHLSERLSSQGEGLEGIYYGTDFLRRHHLGETPPVGERVVVLGGGNVAVDAALVARRLGGRDVRLVCLESREQMPAFAWETEQALAEGILLTCGWGPKHILPDGNRVGSVHVRRCASVLDETGRFAPRFDDSTERVLPADTLIIAIGQSPDLSFLGEAAGFDLFTGTTLRVDPLTLATRLPGVFAGGDMVTGPASVVEAMAAGQKAAESIDRQVRGRDLRTGREDASAQAEVAVPDVEQATVDAAGPPAVGAGALIDADVARREAQRCLRCGYAYEHYGECWYCLPCEIECPTEALELKLPFLVR